MEQDLYGLINFPGLLSSDDAFQQQKMDTI